MSTTYRVTPVRRALAFARNTWRGLTSMRTALILLFLLALAALPGALLPQRQLNPPKTEEYIAAHGWWGRLLDRLQFFDVYSSVWFSAIYLLLMVSLVGCLTPRTFEYVRAMRARPVLTPRNLSRMPHHRRAIADSDPDAVLASTRQRLRGWRVERRIEPDGAVSLSAERGYLRETGNLVFHFAMLGLIVAFALGKLYSYEGQVIVRADGQAFCNAGIYNYDSFDPGLRVDGTGLNPFCVRVNGFRAEFSETNQPVHYEADLEYQSGADLETGTWRPYELRVNEPLRTAGDRVYLLGHGYAPTFTVTFPDGSVRTQTIQWRPTDQTTLLSEGATKFEPPGITDSAERRTRQLAITGLFAPTKFLHGSVLSSAGPELADPAVAVDVLRGDLGVDSGRGQSIFTVDRSMVDSGRLVRVARENLDLGESLTLDDGTKVEFSGVERFVSLQVSHDPTQGWVLGFAVAMMVGLVGSLLVKRRRLWVRVRPEAGSANLRPVVVEVAGLARTDQAGYGEEFTRLADQILGAAGTQEKVEITEKGRT
ncbi:cytochrome c biogenesis protein [Amycolatopsis arida]|uniref:Cytochrome c biogenesis protein n=1 Tax=Amycolatopsis arida TaxID=587909 RepID=A0A1I6A9M7_9PSEU|nr:cytochrome c biogenesis protein ResB [Amycolatopsis arida]TDX88496.1 cytochrome c biogenesis protein [Amycolatopsis arida]SFQ65342.1 cytochrome c biogenesis protein [Amycolatopsis arida]